MGGTCGIVPYLTYTNAAAAVDFLQRAFGLELIARFDDDQGRVMHAELRHGNGILMLGHRTGNLPDNCDGIYLSVDAIEGIFEQATSAGATVLESPRDAEFGSRRCKLADLEGREWSIGTYHPGEI